MYVERAEKIKHHQYDEPAVKSGSKLTFTGSLSTIQENASKIYRTLVQNRCQINSHPTLLLLEQRLKRRKLKMREYSIFNNTPTKSTCFKLSFSGECSSDSQPLDMEFRIVETLPRTRRVQVRAAIAQEESPYDDPSILPRVTNICQYIQQPVHESSGFCLDEAGVLMVYQSLSPAGGQFVDRCLTLDSILPGLQTKLSQEALYYLAITLVASVFQLSHTPWLDQKWSKKNIAFLRAGDDPRLAVDIRYPYLLRSFLQISEPHDQSKMNDCSSLLALAILLLEISLGKPIEHIDTVTDDRTALHAANSWYRADKGRLARGFSKAILTCLQEYLNPDSNFNDPEYCNAVKEKILQPLEDDVQCLLGTA